MSMSSLRDAAAWIPGARVVGDGRRRVRRRVDRQPQRAAPAICSSRCSGERFDAHDFLPRRGASGVAAVLVERVPRRLDAARASWCPTRAPRSAQLARGWRRQFAHAARSRVTGSNGKTTVKEMIASILRRRIGDDARLATRATSTTTSACR